MQFVNQYFKARKQELDILTKEMTSIAMALIKVTFQEIIS